MTDPQPTPKFHVGQVVVMTSIKKELPFRIVSIEPVEDGWFYGWNSKNFVAESSVRKLKPEEVE